MAEKFNTLKKRHIKFIEAQHLYFVSTAGAEGLINLSPKGMDSFRVISKSEICWLNLTGSGNETAAHVAENKRMTVMFCSFEKKPLILRLYGESKVFHPWDSQWSDYIPLFPEQLGARQIFTLNLGLVQTSCGFGVPYYQYQNERPTLNTWARKKGSQGVEQYWKEINETSLDGKPTGIIEPEHD